MIRKKTGIIGGGASGLMAAVSAASVCGREQAGEIVVLEKKDRIGKKILATGNGKCNLTNLDFDRKQLGRYYRGAEEGELSVYFNRFGVQDTLRWFEKMGMLTMNRGGYVYPLSQQAATVLDTLRFELERAGVCVVTECEIRKITAGDRKKGTFLVETQQGLWEFERLILSCGSPAGGKQGEGMDGYGYARGFGHSVSPLFPALVQLKCRGDFWKGLAGVRADALLRMEIGGRTGKKVPRQYEERGELQLTDYGISGIPVFQLSRYASQALSEKKEVKVWIDFFPEARERGEAWEAFIRRRLKEYAGREMEAVFSGLANKKIMQTLMKGNGLKNQDILGKGNHSSAVRVLEQLRSFAVEVSAVNPMQNAQVCAGGVPLCEVTENMESRMCPGLYLTGELLDVDGICGGYNLQWAWTSGYLAGKAAAVR